MKLHRDLKVTQKTAWFLAHRIRKAFTDENDSFTGPVEVDETYMGGKRANMPKAKRVEITGRGAVGKTAVVGAKDRATNQVSAQVVRSTDGPTLQDFVAGRVTQDAQVFTDEASAYAALSNPHEMVNHSSLEHVRGEIHTTVLSRSVRC